MVAFFLRHAESVSNAEPGRDLPDAEGDRLSALGRKQAGQAANELDALGATRLWSSPLRRARETAAPIAERLGLEVEIVDDLGELREVEGFGELSGEEQALRRWSTWMTAHPDDPGFAPPGGESFADLVARAERVKAALLESRADRVLAISHGIFLRFLFGSCLLGEDFRPAQAKHLWQLRSLNCGLSAFEHRRPDEAANPASREWLCLTWMARPWDPPWRPASARSARSGSDR